jgi:hypothetical protein
VIDVLNVPSKCRVDFCTNVDVENDDRDQTGAEHLPTHSTQILFLGCDPGLGFRFYSRVLMDVCQDIS